MGVLHSEYQKGRRLTLTEQNHESDFSPAELAELTKKYQDGITSMELVDLLSQRGFRFSEPTLRKYVQLGILPRSRRIGRKGQRRGSIGVYPPSVISRIALIKRGLRENLTLDDIRTRVGVLSELDALSLAFARLLGGLKQLSQHERDKAQRHRLEQEIKLTELEFNRLHKRLTGTVEKSQTRGD